MHVQGLSSWRLRCILESGGQPARGSTMPPSLMLFSYLQILDALSTVAFLMLGVHEANPLVRFAFSLGLGPIAGLALVKGAALTIGAYCAMKGREKLLGRANLLFAALVAWNLLAVILG